MFTADSRHKGLATFRAHRAEKKEIAILAGEVAKSNPDKTPQECKILAMEIRAARKRETERKAERAKSKGKGKRKPRLTKGNRNSSRKAPVVTVINRKGESNA